MDCKFIPFDYHLLSLWLMLMSAACTFLWSGMCESYKWSDRISAAGKVMMIVAMVIAITLWVFSLSDLFRE